MGNRKIIVTSVTQSHKKGFRYFQKGYVNAGVVWCSGTLPHTRDRGRWCENSVDANISSLDRKPKGGSRHLICVKKLVLLTCAALLVVALKYTDQSGVASNLFDGVIIPFKIALLYTKEPDRELTIPVEGVRVEQIKNTWHAPRSNNRLHEGQDIFAKRGTAVHSATSGYVLSVGENSLGGKTVFVVGAGGRRYYYAHLDDYAVGLAVGDYVTPQTVLGFVGSTGNAQGTPPHLHFGVYTMAGTVDPLPLLQQRVCATLIES